MTEAVGLVASVIAIIELSAKLTDLCLQYSKDVKHAKEDILLMIKEITNLKAACETTESLLNGPDGNKLRASQDLKGSIENAKLRVEKINQALEPGTGRKTMKKIGLRSLVWPFKKKDVQDAISGLESCRQAIIQANLTDSLSLQLVQAKTLQGVEAGVTDANQKLSRIEREKVLGQLPVAQGAGFDSGEEINEPMCHPDTRQEIIAEIKDWSIKPDSQALFWLNGMAGTGKSTISRTVAASFAKSGHLGASFFFKTGDGDRGRVTKFVTTVASQLAKVNDVFASRVHDVLAADSSIVAKGPLLQYQQLILGPMSDPSNTTWRDSVTVIVVDALDECETEEAVRLVIDLLSRADTLQTVKLKVFLTSRPELPVRLGFGNKSGVYHDLILHEIRDAVIRHDIMAYLSTEVVRIRKDYNVTVSPGRRLADAWPSTSNLATLTDMAIPLFIFASTICRFLADRRLGNPDSQLNKVLAFQTQGQDSVIDRTYLSVLRPMFLGLSPQGREEALKEFRDVVGSIVLLASPLSVKALSKLLDIEVGIIESRLDLLHSVIKVPENPDTPVRLFHLSFRDFLLNPGKRDSNEFWSEEATGNRSLFTKCLRVMRKGLKTDICGLGSPGTPTSTLSAERVAERVPPELHYACLYWAFHLKEADAILPFAEEVYEFLKYHFLQWIEVLSIMGRYAEATSALKTLQSSLSGGGKLSSFLGDSIRFLSFASIASSHPLQIYASGLSFAPQNSAVRQTFAKSLPQWIIQTPEVDAEWDSCLNVLEGHQSQIQALAFSADSELLATASDDGTIRIWHTSTGVCRNILVGHKHYATDVAFSSDAKLIVSGCSDRTTRIWTNSGENIHTFNESGRFAISHDSSMVAIVSQDDGNKAKITVWRVGTEQRIWETQLPGSDPCVAFSPDLKFLATASEDQIEIRRVDSDMDLIEQVNLPSAHSIVFCPDSTQLAALSDWEVWMWNVNSGDLVRIYDDAALNIFWVDLLPDAQCVAFVDFEGHIRALRVDTGEQVLKAPLPQNDGSGVALSTSISPSGTLYAMALHDGSAWLLEIDPNKEAEPLEEDSLNFRNPIASQDGSFVVSMENMEESGTRHLVRVWGTTPGRYLYQVDKCNLVVFSPDSKILALSRGELVLLHRAADGACLSTLEGHNDEVRPLVFSEDGALIATASGDETARLWDVQTAACRQILRGHNGSVNQIALSSRLSLVATCSTAERCVRLWNHAGECLRTYGDESSFSPQSLAFSQTSSLLGISDKDSITIWDCNTGLRQKTVGHRGVSKLAFWDIDAYLTILTTEGDLARIHPDTAEDLFRIRLRHQPQYVTAGAEDEYLATYTGVIRVGPGSLKPSSSHIGTTQGVPVPGERLGGLQGIGLSADGNWILYKAEKVMWLPPKYRSSPVLVLGQTAALVCRPDRVMFVGLDEAKLDRHSRRSKVVR